MDALATGCVYSCGVSIRCLAHVGCDHTLEPFGLLFVPWSTTQLKDEGKAVESALETSLTSSLGEGETENDIFEHSLDETQEQNEISENVYSTETRHKFVGEFNVPLSSIKFAAEDRAVRELNPTHLSELEASFRTNLANGIWINFPPATGVIFEEEFRNEVELIDGNHTHHVMLHMQELYPEKEELKTRKVIVYRELSQGAISFLGLSRNDETTNSLKTSHFEELKIMRKLLYSKHGGKFSNRYQDDIYQLFNALCPGVKKKKTLTAPYSTVNYGSRLLGAGC
uniref:Uncharacterized protein LOC111114202 n=1 Tax=Crassostrea virginica TaxID=6565 RepID=A0A8B8BZB7_CRAVI|nr:uncharacterized protein LOC111114202 [Crassostrea virginica]